MPFEPGHTINIGSEGVSKVKLKRAASLALEVRTLVTPQEIVNWLKQVWLDGVDPTGEARTVVSMDLRMQALQILLNRGWGQAAQHIVVEADVRNTLSDSGEVSAPTDIYDARERRARLRQAKVKSKMIETTAIERKEMDVADVMPSDGT